MKAITFGVDCRLNPQDEHPYIVNRMLPLSDDNIEIAKEQSYNGEYVIEDIPDAQHEPTSEEILLELAVDHEARLCEIELGV